MRVFRPGLWAGAGFFRSTPLAQDAASLSSLVEQGSLATFIDSAGQTLSTVSSALPWLLWGAGITTATVVVALAIGFCLGVPLAVLQVYGSKPVRRLVGLYVWFFRGVPILVLLYLFYFGIAYQLGLDFTPFMASCLVLGLTSTAYQSQIFRGSIEALPQGQTRAAIALGMNRRTTVFSIILPQALRHSIPAWSNEFSILLKDSALVSVLGTLDLMARTKAIATSTAEYAAFYATAALLYFLVTYAGNSLLKLVERSIRIPGYSRR